VVLPYPQCPTACCGVIYYTGKLLFGYDRVGILEEEGRMPFLSLLFPALLRAGTKGWVVVQLAGGDILQDDYIETKDKLTGTNEKRRAHDSPNSFCKKESKIYITKIYIAIKIIAHHCC
jgi:hypothetical protein